MADRQGILIRFGAVISDFLTGKNQVRDELKDLGTGVEEVGDDAEKASTKTTAALDDVGDSAGEAGDSLGDLGAVGKQALDGDIGGAAESAAGLLGNFGAAGALAGTVAAAGIKLVSDEIEKQKERAAALTKQFAGMYSTAIQDGRTFLNESQILKEALDIQWNPDRADEYNKALDDAKTLGLDIGTVLRAQAGDQAALNEVLKISGDRFDEVADKAKSYTGATQGSSNPVLTKLLGEKNVLGDIVSRYSDVRDAQDDAAAKALVSQQIIADSNAEQRRGIDADQERYEALAAHIDGLNGQKVDIPVKFSLDTVGVERYIADLKRRRIPIVADVVDRYGRDVP